MSMEVGALLSSSPEIRHGRPCIRGTGISVHRIAVLHNLGHSPEEIVRKYEHLTIAGVHAALAYYYANKQEIDAEVAADETDAAEIEREFLNTQQVA
ncbi:MAG TPA: DUF433 domain-containing protein [Pyrinomonadaceae bacterium]|nr:DUF433 domain-containing protein [Pyrinomonadaceae bacterium]